MDKIRRITQSDVLSSYSNHVGVDTNTATDGITGLLIVLDFAHSLVVEALEKGTITEQEAQSIFDALNSLFDGYEFE